MRESAQFSPPVEKMNGNPIPASLSYLCFAPQLQWPPMGPTNRPPSRILSSFPCCSMRPSRGPKTKTSQARVERISRSSAKGVQPGGGRIAICLKQHESELSPRCRERIVEAKEQIQEFAEACKRDAEKSCKGVQPGRGRIARCLVEHKDQLSAGCREKIPWRDTLAEPGVPV